MQVKKENMKFYWNQKNSSFITDDLPVEQNEKGVVLDVVCSLRCKLSCKWTLLCKDLHVVHTTVLHEVKFSTNLEYIIFSSNTPQQNSITQAAYTPFSETGFQPITSHSMRVLWNFGHAQ